MKTNELTMILKSSIAVLAFLLSPIITFAGGTGSSNPNHLFYDLGNAQVTISFNNESLSGSKQSINDLDPAKFKLNKNMMVNATHLNKGEYEVLLIENKDGLSLLFHSIENKKEDVVVLLDSKVGTTSSYINYSLIVVEDDKLQGEIKYGGMDYLFTMEVALSNKIFSYLKKEELENTSDWLDYYQAGIYAFKNTIDLEESYQYAEKALREEQNEYTLALSLLYLEALGRSSEAQQLSALQE